MTENTAGGTVETPNEDVNWEERAKKAEAKIVDLKKSSKEEVEKKEETPETPKEVLDESSIQRILASEKFMDANPELREHKATFDKLTSSWLSEAGAKAAILADNPEITNRQKTNSMSITGDIVTPDKSTYTMDEVKQLASNDQRGYNALMDRVDKWEVTIT